MALDLTISIVLYKSDREKLKAVIDSVYQTTLAFKLYLIDNSPTDDLKIFARERTEYIFNNKNIGFGKAHNIAMRRSIEEARYHLVLNPDVFFGPNVLERLFTYMQTNEDVGLVSPKILYPDNQTQHLCKLLPTPMDLFMRRFMGNGKWVEKRSHRYELRESGYNKTMNIPYLSGCFMFIRSSVLKEVGLFDERIFMYIEDADLTRRIHYKYKTLYFPEVQIYHHYAKGSYKNKKLMMYNIHGACVYFFKWGWFFDPTRKQINKKVINNYLTV
jgi:GT2 family glycosyltransferase